MSSVDEMDNIEHAPKIRPGQVWLCVEHHEDPDADCSCGLTPYLPRSEVEALERQLAGAVDLAHDLLEFVEAMDGDRPKSLGPLKVVVRAREFLTRAGGQS
jgi:hypothetical protein